MKILQNKFIKSTLVLMLSGMATKVLGMVIRIIFTRTAGTRAIALYTLVMPTYSLFLTICSLAMPTTIAKLVSENDNVKVINSATVIILILNALVCTLMFLISPFIANQLLKEPNSYYLLIAMTFTLPFASIACILKGYYYGKQKMLPHVISNTTEQLIRLAIVFFIIPILVKKSYVYAAIGLILTSTVTELASIIVYLLCMNKKDVIKISKISINNSDAKNILNISVPNVSSRIVGNICFFFEPIVLTNILLSKGYSSSFIVVEYGVYNAYAISTLTIPSFFISAIALALVPEISKLVHRYDYKTTKKRLKQAFILTFIIGCFFTTIIYIFRDKILMLMYNTIAGSNYIKALAPFFILFYLESIFAAFFQAIGKTKVCFRVTLIGSIVKLGAIVLFAFLNRGMYSLIYAEIINIIFVISLDIKYFIKEFSFSN